MERRWWHKETVYQIYPRSFMDSNGDGIGDLPGVIGKLDYLQELGIGVIWLSPVYQSPMNDNGYDISDYRNIAPEFGTMEDMDLLIAEAGKRSIRVIMDLVINHTSCEHPLFLESRSSKDNPYRDYYFWRKPAGDGGPPNGFRSLFGGSAWELDKATGEYYFHLFDKSQPDLNLKNPQVKQMIYDTVNWWLEKGIAGFRMDAIDHIAKDVDKEIFRDEDLLHEMIRELTRETYGSRNLLTVGETWSVTPETAKRYSNPDGSEFDMVFQFEQVVINYNPEQGKWSTSDRNPKKLKDVLIKWQTELGDGGWNALFWNNHDLPRIISYRGDEETYPLESAKMLAALLHLMRGTPYIYQGEEIGMTNYPFQQPEDFRDVESLNHIRTQMSAGVPFTDLLPGLRVNSRDNARTPMQWDCSEFGGFSTVSPWINCNPNKTTINTESTRKNPDSLFYFYRKLIRLRKELDIILYGDFTPLQPEDEKSFHYKREHKEKKLWVFNNMTSEEIPFALPRDIKTGIVLTANYPLDNLASKASLRPYESFSVLM